MILESTQMLCTVLHRYGLKAPYKPTHMNHPCTLWAGDSRSDWLWLRGLSQALYHEYRYRFGEEKVHRSAEVARALEPPPAPERGLLPFPQAMPEKYRLTGDPVSAYRSYYIAEKKNIFRWTRREAPDWLE